MVGGILEAACTGERFGKILKLIDDKFEWLDAEEFRNRWLIRTVRERGIL